MTIYQVTHVRRGKETVFGWYRIFERACRIADAYNQDSIAAHIPADLRGVCEVRVVGRDVDISTVPPVVIAHLEQDPAGAVMTAL